MKSKRFFFLFLVSLFIVFLGMPPFIVQAALPAHMTIEGDSQGNIEGSCEKQGREGTIVVYSFGHSVRQPFDPQSGAFSGQRIHDPIEILKAVDISSPKLYKALCEKEKLSNVTIKFYNINSEGFEEHYFTITLTNAYIVKIAPSFPPTFVPENVTYRYVEIVTMTYQTIKWNWENGSIEHQDNWSAPIG